MDEPPENHGEEIVSEPLEIDEEELSNASRERGRILDISDEIRLLAKQNRLTLFKNKAGRRKNSAGGWRAETELQFQSHAHPDCRFVQAMLTVSLDLTPGAKVLTVRPDRAMVHPVKVSESIKPAFEVGIPGIGLKATLGGEKTTEQTFDQPVLTGYNGEDRAIWTFKAPASGYELSLNVPLQLAIEYPATVEILRASVQMSARVAVRGWTDFIPLIGSKSGTGTASVYLDR